MNIRRIVFLFGLKDEYIIWVLGFDFFMNLIGFDFEGKYNKK